MSTAPKGPASYFPSIEAKYGRSIDDWLTHMRAKGPKSHKELVSWLKQEHGFGHGHATAITHHLLSEGHEQSTPDEHVAALFPPKKAHWRPVYDTLLREIRRFGDVTIVPKRTVVDSRCSSRPPRNVSMLD